MTLHLFFLSSFIFEFYLVMMFYEDLTIFMFILDDIELCFKHKLDIKSYKVIMFNI